MTTLENLIGNQTYQVIDNKSNRFNFFGLVNVAESLSGKTDEAVEYVLTDYLPEDVRIAVNTMIENNVDLNDYTGIVSFKNDDDTYYLLTW